MFPNTLLLTDVEDSCVFHSLDILSVLHMRVVLMEHPQCSHVGLFTNTPVFERACTPVLFGVLERVDEGVVEVSYLTCTSCMLISLLHISQKACPYRGFMSTSAHMSPIGQYSIYMSPRLMTSVIKEYLTFIFPPLGTRCIAIQHDPRVTLIALEHDIMCHILALCFHEV